MNAHELKQTLADLSLSQVDFSRLIEVTARTVNLWTTDEREIPGPAAAYLRLLRSLPEALRFQEIARLRGEVVMPEGIYKIEFAGRAGTGLGVLVLTDGRIVGTDGGVDYDGTYAPSGNQVQAAIRCTVRPGTELVMGVRPQAHAYSFDLSAAFPAGGSGRINVPTPFGASVVVDIAYLRPLH